MPYYVETNWPFSASNSVNLWIILLSTFIVGGLKQCYPVLAFENKRNSFSRFRNLVLLSFNF
jgi:hypothetical protein